jgi:hypothetical protein
MGVKELVPGRLYVARSRIWFSHLNSENPEFDDTIFLINEGDVLVYLRRQLHRAAVDTNSYEVFLTCHGVIGATSNFGTIANWLDEVKT